MRRLLQVLLALYIAGAVLAGAIMIPAVARLLGQAPDPLSALPAMALALPWSWLLMVIDSGPAVSSAILLIALALNIALALFGIRRLSPRRVGA